ncbi:MAG: hypothetical protein IPJ04_01010 [Candidatus Eisenbacteria bacterium]|nr:hypothetical protein [Candidatus Eisenbacteria bacterium]
MRRLIVSALLVAAVALAATALAADRGARKLDVFWQTPDLASLDLRAIALLPVATFDGSLEARRYTEDGVGKALRGSGHRWLSPAVSREMLRQAGGDSLLKAVNTKIVNGVRVDSLDAPYLCRVTRASALLTVRVEQFEKREMEFNQSGKPVTTVNLRAALVDSTGRLLWTASGAENAEGPYHDANSGAIGVNASGLNNTPLTNQAGAPGYPETLAKLLGRWAQAFPRRGAAPAAPAATDSTVAR